MPAQRTSGRIDVHSHLLPGVDDGCPSVDEALFCASRLVDNGYTHAFCTPHVWPGFPENTGLNIPRWTREFQRRLSDAGLRLQVYPGGEINIQAMWPALASTPPEQVPTMGMQGRYVLVDFWAERLPDEFEPGVRHLQSLGMTVILAHPERIGAFQREPGLADAVRDMGVLLQGNFQCFSEPAGSPSRSLLERYLAEERYFLLGLDIHRLNTLHLRLDGLARAIERLGAERVDRFTVENPRMLLPPEPAGPELGDAVSSEEFTAADR